MILFDRKAYLKIDGKEIRNLDFQFTVRKSLSPEIDKCNLTIVNLPKSERMTVAAGSALGGTQAGLAARNARIVEVEIFAGYASQTLPRVFIGQIYRSQSSYQSHTWLTNIDCGDGEGRRQIFANQAFEQGTRTVDIIRALVKIAGVKSGNLEAQIAAGVFTDSQIVTFNNGYATSGQALEALNVILRAYDIRWTIQDDEIKIVKSNGTTLDPPVNISSVPENTGLVGQPEHTDKGGLLFRSLLRSDLVPGRLVNVTSRQVTFSGRIEYLTHIADTRGGPWYSVVEAADLNNLLAYDTNPLLQ